jgi:isopentenyl-diphosphate delta-isomerase
VERHRIQDPLRKRVAARFAGWGIPTAEALHCLHAAFPHVPLIASGGLESGVDVAKCLALGANLAGMAWPLLRPALHSVEAVQAELQVVVQELQVTMFCIGAKDVDALRQTPYLQEVNG